MPQFEITYRGRARGPISDGRIHRHVQEYSADAAEAIANEAERQLLLRFGQVLRHPTGYYTSHIDTREITPTRYEVHDNDMVYGPWLEGTGSRNSPKTVFPGYRTFEVIERRMKEKRSGIARRILRQHRSRGRLR